MMTSDQYSWSCCAYRAFAQRVIAANDLALAGIESRFAPEKIVTDHVYPPIPDRRFDWCAYQDKHGGEPGSPIGQGPTEAAAIADLAEEIELHEEMRNQ